MYQNMVWKTIVKKVGTEVREGRRNVILQPVAGTKRNFVYSITETYFHHSYREINQGERK